MLRQMKPPFLRSFAAACLFALAPVQAGSFIPPAEGPVPFRRDRLPLDADSMSTLSQQLVNLTGTLDTAAPARLRTAAQLLALALALDPANRAARTTIESLNNGRPPASVDSIESARAKARVWRTLAWLQEPEAGNDGQAFAACLADVIAAADPDQPSAKSLAGNPEQGAWTGWVADLKSFEGNPITVVTPTDDAMPPEVPEITPADTKATFRLTEATLITPLWALDPVTKTTTLRPVPVVLNITTSEPKEDEEDRPFSFRLENTDDSSYDKKLNAPVIKALTAIHGPLPRNTRAGITIGDGVEYLRNSNHNAIAGPAALLIHSALTGVPPKATILGIIDDAGTYQLTPYFWDNLRALENGPGGRLVLPAAAADFLPSFLALEKSDFFFRYEVLLASDLAELVERAADTSTGPVADTSAKFIEIRSRIGGQTTPQYVSNSYVRQRLAAIVQEAPHHHSARLLAIQGAGERPTRLQRNVLAAELRAAIRPMDWITRHEDEEIDTSALDKTYTSCRSAVDELEGYIDSRDRELYEQVRSLTLSIRTLAREARVRARPGESPPNIRRAVSTFATSYTTTRDDLTATAGDDPPSPAPASPAPAPR
jgi:hypothetical protein